MKRLTQVALLILVGLPFQASWASSPSIADEFVCSPSVISPFNAIVPIYSIKLNTNAATLREHTSVFEGKQEVFSGDRVGADDADFESEYSKDGYTRYVSSTTMLAKQDLYLQNSLVSSGQGIMISVIRGLGSANDQTETRQYQCNRSKLLESKGRFQSP